MLTKIRSTLRRTKHLVVVAVSVAVLSAGVAAPTVHAKDSNNNQVTSDENCASLEDAAKRYTTAWLENLRWGRKLDAEYALGNLQNAISVAYISGCDWAEQARTQQRPRRPLPPAGSQVG